MKNPESNYELITPDIAREILKKNNSNRPVNKLNLSLLVNEINRGNFKNTGESIKIAVNGDLLDGQHRLLAIQETGIAQNMLVVRGLENDSFKYIDTGRKRMPSDVLAIEGLKNPTKLAAMVQFIIRFERGFYVAATNMGGAATNARITNADVADFALKNLQELEDSFEYGFDKHNRIVSKNTLASMHYIFKKISKKHADDFCWRLAKGNDLKEDSPIYLLRERYLQDIRATRKMSSLEKVAILCKAWNHYRNNVSLKQLKWDSIREPFPKPL